MKVIAIVGPTAIGKSCLALELASEFGGEIVSADSRQVYRYLDIGTAKPSAQDRDLVPHHLIDVVNPDEPFSLALYQDMAYRALEDINRRGKVAFLVGGTGLYVRAVLDGWRLPRVAPDPHLRRRLEERARAGGGALYGELARLDPAAAASIDPRNLRRVIRALEVCYATGATFSALRGVVPPAFEALVIGLTAPRDVLYQRIDARVDEMVRRGLVEEVRRLVGQGYGFDLPAMSGIGYREMGRYLRGELDLSTAVERIQFETHRFARHQYGWFRLSDERIRWFDISASRQSAREIGRLLGQAPHHRRGCLSEALEAR
jgi:tRNA dimethylallyltransferase